MRFEEVLPQMRKGRIAKIRDVKVRLQDHGFEFDIDCDYWECMILLTEDILSDKWQLMDE